MKNDISAIFNNQKTYSPYIIAEIGVNHGGDIELAKKLIDLVADAGGHAAKFQTYKSEKLASKHSPAYWDTTKEKCQSQYELFKKYDSFTYKEYEILSNHCKNSGITFVSKSRIPIIGSTNARASVIPAAVTRSQRGHCCQNCCRFLSIPRPLIFAMTCGNRSAGAARSGKSLSARSNASFQLSETGY